MDETPLDDEHDRFKDGSSGIADAAERVGDDGPIPGGSGAALKTLSLPRFESTAPVSAASPDWRPSGWTTWGVAAVHVLATLAVLSMPPTRIQLEQGMRVDIVTLDEDENARAPANNDATPVTSARQSTTPDSLEPEPTKPLTSEDFQPPEAVPVPPVQVPAPTPEQEQPEPEPEPELEPRIHPALMPPPIPELQRRTQPVEVERRSLSRAEPTRIDPVPEVFVQEYEPQEEVLAPDVDLTIPSPQERRLQPRQVARPARPDPVSQTNSELQVNPGRTPLQRAAPGTLAGPQGRVAILDPAAENADDDLPAPAPSRQALTRDEQERRDQQAREAAAANAPPSALPVTPTGELAAGGGGSGTPASAGGGVTALGGGAGASSGAGAGSGSGAGPSLPGASGGQPEGGPAGGNIPANGPLPRRPPGPGVRGTFTNDQRGGLLGRMDQDAECRELARDRDRAGELPERCRGSRLYEPGRTGGTIAPRAPPPSNTAAPSNPLPLCPPGTPQGRMGESCLPSTGEPPTPKL